MIFFLAMRLGHTFSLPTTYSESQHPSSTTDEHMGNDECYIAFLRCHPPYQPSSSLPFTIRLFLTPVSSPL